VSGWSVRATHADLGGAVAFELRRADAAIEIAIRRRGERPALVSTAAGDVAYTRFSGVTEEEAARAARGFAAALDRDPAQVLDRFPHLAPELCAIEVVAHAELDLEGLSSFLGPELREGAPWRGFVLRAVYAEPRGRVVELERGELVVRALVGVDLPDPVFARAGPLAIAPLLYGHGDAAARVPADAASVLSWLAVLLAKKQSPGFRVRAARRLPVVPAASIPAGDTVHVTLSAECGQSCVFCSIKSFVPPDDGGEPLLASLRVRLAAEPAKNLRLTGIEPLAFSGILDLAAEAKALGYAHLAIETSGRRLAQPRFLADLLARAPERVTFVVPLYAASAADHDAVTGAPGSHAEVLAALDALATTRAEVVLSTVVTRQNVDALAGLVDFAARRSSRLESHLPYPLRRSRADAYARAALPGPELVSRALAGASPATRVEIERHLGSLVVHPCVLERAGIALPASPSPLNSARDSTSDRFAPETVPCPHAAACPLSERCPKAHYALHGDLFGLAELAPPG
jgi:MoaA/NifB/PqqE/SkfB family radical SAM enzyme